MTWTNRLIKKAIIDSPVVEYTPVIWSGRLYLVETWQTHWDGGLESEKQFYARIREEESNRVISEFMEGYGFASGFVWKDALYVFGTRISGGSDLDRTFGDIYVSKSQNLTDWTDPRVIIERDEGEQLFNESVCYDGRRFVMAYESNTHVPFTLKFAESDDLGDWRKVPDAMYGPEKYAACPAIRYVGGYYYMLYLEHLKPRWWFETWLTRSEDLIHWEDAPRNPVIAPDPSHRVYPTCPEHIERGCPANLMECNASDPDLVEWHGKVRVYFTGGCQHWAGYLQYAEFDGSMQGFFESYYE